MCGWNSPRRHSESCLCASWRHWALSGWDNGRMDFTFYKIPHKWMNSFKATLVRLLPLTPEEPLVWIHSPLSSVSLKCTYHISLSSHCPSQALSLLSSSLFFNTLHLNLFFSPPLFCLNPITLHSTKGTEYLCETASYHSTFPLLCTTSSIIPGTPGPKWAIFPYIRVNET